MYRTINILGVVIVLALFAGAFFLARSYYTGTYVPTVAAVKGTAIANETINRQTQTASAKTEAEKRTRTAAAQATERALTETAVAAAQTETAHTATQSAVLTLAAMPTITPSPTLAPTLTPTPAIAMCDAKVLGTSRNMYPVPGTVPSYGGVISIPADTTLQVIAGLNSPAWVAVRYDNRVGFMRADTLSLQNCDLKAVDLHYVAGWLAPGSDWRLLVDDIFSQNKYAWTSERGENPEAKSNKGVGILEVGESQGDVVFSNDILRQTAIGAFEVHSYFTLDPGQDDAYIGIRFRDNGTLFYEVRLLTGNCSFVVVNEQNEVFSGSFSPAFCSDRYYFMDVSLDEQYQLKLSINNAQPQIINLQDPEGKYVMGALKFSLHNMEADFGYIVVTHLKRK